MCCTTKVTFRRAGFVAQAFLPAVSPTFLSAKRILPNAGWKACETADKNAFVTAKPLTLLGQDGQKITQTAHHQLSTIDSACVALCRINSDRSADSLFTVALAEVNLVRMDFGRTNRLSKVSSGTRDFDRVFHLVSACFTWFQLFGKKKRNAEAENLRFQLRGTDAQVVLADCQCPPRNVSLTQALRRGPFQLVSPRFTLFHLREKN